MRRSWWREPPGGASLLIGLLALVVAIVVGAVQLWPSSTPAPLRARIDVVYVGPSLTPATTAIDLSVFNPRSEPVQLTSVFAVDTAGTPARLTTQVPLAAAVLSRGKGFVPQRYTPVPQTIEAQEQKDIYLDARQVYATGAPSLVIRTASGFTEVLQLGPLRAVLRCAIRSRPGLCVSVAAFGSTNGMPYVQHVLGGSPIGTVTGAVRAPKICEQIKAPSNSCLLNVRLVSDPTHGGACREIRKVDPASACDPKTVQIFNGEVAVDRGVHVYTSPELPGSTSK